MKRLTIFSLTCLFSVGAVFAQQGVTQCGVPTGQPKFPLQTYQELPDPAAPSDKEWAAVTTTQVSWGTTDVRYAKHGLPRLKNQQTVALKGWRGERVNAQAVVWTGVELKDLNFSFGDFKDKKGNVLPQDAFTGGFVRYVMTDELNKDGRGACGHRKAVDYDSLLVADPIDTSLKAMALPARTVQPVWVQCWIPQSAVPGTYKGELLINDGSRLLQRLNLEITVSSRELPAPSEWAYHLDLWQSPYAVARYYQVPLWSQEHLDAMRPLMKMLADAGHDIVGEAANGQEAVKLAAELKPDFIIMDVKMPIMDGITAAKIIAADNIAPVLLLTAYSQRILLSRHRMQALLLIWLSLYVRNSSSRRWRLQPNAFRKCISLIWSLIS